jgi:kynurenine formamidase
VVLIRTGTAQYWGESGADHDKLRGPDTAGIGLTAAKWLIEEQGAMMIGSDTSGLECAPAKEADSKAMGGSFIPVHAYMLVEQGVHVLEFHNLEQLAADQAYEFAYFLAPNMIRGTVAGTAQHPVAMR